MDLPFDELRGTAHTQRLIAARSKVLESFIFYLDFEQNLLIFTRL